MKPCNKRNGSTTYTCKYVDTENCGKTPCTNQIMHNQFSASRIKKSKGFGKTKKSTSTMSTLSRGG